jgi:hypothetical protein
MQDIEVAGLRQGVWRPFHNQTAFGQGPENPIWVLQTLAPQKNLLRPFAAH